MREEGCIRCLLVIVFAAALLRAAAADARYRRVKRGVWLWPGTAGGLLFALRAAGEPGEYGRLLLEILCFVLLQFRLFSKLYGRADCFAFSCCGIFLGAFGGGIREYLLHMLLSVGLLGAVQFCRGNVDRRGNLKEPQPFIPYIAAALAVMILWRIFRETAVSAGGICAGRNIENACAAILTHPTRSCGRLAEGPPVMGSGFENIKNLLSCEKR